MINRYKFILVSKLEKNKWFPTCQLSHPFASGAGKLGTSPLAKPPHILLRKGGAASSSRYIEGPLLSTSLGAWMPLGWHPANRWQRPARPVRAHVSKIFAAQAARMVMLSGPANGLSLGWSSTVIHLGYEMS